MLRHTFASQLSLMHSKLRPALPSSCAAWSRHAVLSRNDIVRATLLGCPGSERQRKSGAVGERLKEASCINLSLTTLNHVIMSICRGQRAPPFRDSALTRLLQVSVFASSSTLITLTYQVNW